MSDIDLLIDWCDRNSTAWGLMVSPAQLAQIRRWAERLLA